MDTAVVTDNAGAARFYARMGYRALGEERCCERGVVQGVPSPGQRASRAPCGLS
jgi:hypothetical protein